MRSADSTWAWVRELYSLGFRFSFFEGRSPGEVLTAFDVVPAEAEMMTFDEAGEEFYDYPDVYRAGETGGWGFALEEFGGDHDAQLRELSAGGRAASVVRVETGLSVFAYFEDGEQTCRFEPLSPYDRVGPEADRFRPAMRRVGLDPDGQVDLDLIAPEIAALDLVTELFGVRLDAATARGPLLTGRVEPDLSWMDDDYAPPPIRLGPPVFLEVRDGPSGPPPGGTSVGV